MARDCGSGPRRSYLCTLSEVEWAVSIRFGGSSSVDLSRIGANFLLARELGKRRNIRIHDPEGDVPMHARLSFSGGLSATLSEVCSGIAPRRLLTPDRELGKRSLSNSEGRRIEPGWLPFFWSVLK